MQYTVSLEAMLVYVLGYSPLTPHVKYINGVHTLLLSVCRYVMILLNHGNNASMRVDVLLQVITLPTVPGRVLDASTPLEHTANSPWWFTKTITGEGLSTNKGPTSTQDVNNNRPRSPNEEPTMKDKSKPLRKTWSAWHPGPKGQHGEPS